MAAGGPPPDTGIFSDLSSNHWAYNSIMELVREKVLSGYPDGTFKPGNPVTRAEFSKCMVYGLGCRGMESNAAWRLKDVPENYWAKGVISIAVDKGYVKGKSGGIFDPDGKITGAELAAMLVRALPPGKRAKAESGPYWYSGSVQLAEENGLL
ncbi:S-layer homology domain-containing protein [Desulfoscipio geothermicus]|nr:S-layer homology domain-containing protein [Desulfoscipio geothermicus]